MVVAGRLQTRLIESRPQRCRFGEVQRSAFDALYFPGRNQSFVRRCVVVCGEPQLVTENIPETGEVEITVVCQIDRRGLVGVGLVINA